MLERLSTKSGRSKTLRIDFQIYGKASATVLSLFHERLTIRLRHFLQNCSSLLSRKTYYTNIYIKFIYKI